MDTPNKEAVPVPMIRKVQRRVAQHNAAIDMHLTLRWRDAMRVPPCDEDCGHGRCRARTGLSRRLREAGA